MNVQRARTGVKYIPQSKRCMYILSIESNTMYLPMSSEHFGRFQHHHLVFPSMAIGTMQNILYLTRNHLPRRVKELIVPVFNFSPSHYRVYMFLFLSLLFACKQGGVLYFAHLSQQKKSCSV